VVFAVIHSKSYIQQALHKALYLALTGVDDLTNFDRTTKRHLVL